MNVIGFIPDLDSAKGVIAWVNAIVDKNESVQYFYIDSDDKSQLRDSLRAEIEKSLHPESELTQVSTIAPVVEILEKCQKSKAKLLVSTDFDLEESSGMSQSGNQLLKSSPIETHLLLSNNAEISEVQKILVIASHNVNDMCAINVAEAIGMRQKAEFVLSTVENPSSADEVRTGRKFLETLLHDAGLDHDGSEIDTRVVVDSNLRRGIVRCHHREELVVAGRDELEAIQSVSHHLSDTSIVVVKRAPALSVRKVSSWVPRIHPADHADLLHNLRQGSLWNSDFVLMLGLASAIASLGLLQNSPAVIIGSMLLAPLMTPMIGAGLALAEAAPKMALLCTRTVAKGFLLTLAVSFTVGIVTPSRETLSPEILSRGDANVLDLLIAVFSAVAATVAMSRPGIGNAVAGVAIATALVPPVCSIGLSLSLGYWANGIGAAILFLTNLIAIVIASSVTFTLLGVSSDQAIQYQRRFAQFVRVVLVILLAAIAGPLTSRLVDQLHEGRPQTAMYPVTRAVARVIRERVNRDPGVEIILMGRGAVVDGVVIYLASDHNLPSTYGNELRDLVREAMGDQEVKVYVVMLDGQWVTSENFSAE